MTKTPRAAPRFSWRHFAITAAGCIGILGLFEWYWYERDGAWTTPSKGVLLVLGWILCALGYRFHQLIREQSDGTFSEERYAADPVGYINGSRKFQWVTIGVGVLIGLVYSFLSVTW